MPHCEDNTKAVKMEELSFERERLVDNMVYISNAMGTSKTQINELTSTVT
jgi:hypothetical protein